MKAGVAWQDKLGGPSAGQTAPFAVDFRDEQRAWELLSEIRADEATWEEVEAAFRPYLVERGTGAEWIDEQIRSVERHYRPWLRYQALLASEPRVRP